MKWGREPHEEPGSAKGLPLPDSVAAEASGLGTLSPAPDTEVTTLPETAVHAAEMMVPGIQCSVAAMVISSSD